MTLPPDNITGLLIRRMAALYHRLDQEIGVRPLVLPDSTCFPDPFTADEKSVRRLVRRMKSHAGMTDVPTKVRVLDAENLLSDDHNAHDCSGGCHAESARPSSTFHTTASSNEISPSNAAKCGSASCGNCGTVPI